MHKTDTAGPAPGGWTPSSRYPDPAIEVLDPAFARLRIMNSAVERLYTGARWSEGPVWFADARCLYWSDIPNNRIMRWDEASGAAFAWRQPSDNANGNTRDREGRLVTCEHLTRRVTRTEHDGRITVLADRYDGRRLNSPNDVIVAPDGAVWFSDPEFGILGHYEGEKAEPELPTNLYRLDPATGELRVMADDIARPNGLCFSPDGKLLYVVESGAAPRNILVYDVTGDGTRIANRRVFLRCGPAESPDGFRCDVEGNLWCGWGMGEGLDGVRVFTPEAKPVLHIHLPERCANLCFGGRHRSRLFMAASRSLYAVHVGTQGAAGG
ncbi:SMP-30/gluconolactonase/LRE family protein [Roseomonas sp. NAR14]|uniref:SMP-30/gluconolactonase/LRE family protein n=1 Tax=Roseomonas acroporae TaxID=2937791 RepID=A0A9X1Y3Z5_9PROT|nr:SMP-30/gluconolactonase/LRE family protein [Roseomonas acroporae]MCK8782873.1 SMP-30/gluconolactonase/LRE family protein [Roseomonas acroporae]